MRRQQHAHRRSRRRKLDEPTIVERATRSRFGVDGHLIGGQLQPLLNGRLRNEVIVFPSHDHRRPFCSLFWACRQQIRQGSRIAIQPIETNDHVGQRKREGVGIRLDHVACLFELVAILPIAGVSKRAQKLMRMRL